TTFHDALKHLLDCGISKSHLQNLAKNPDGKVIPFVRLFELKMADQLPPDYVQPVSQYTPKRGLHLVA
ncbi:TPA: phage/plasmid replication protein, II/X family, partial [Acinetobacter baumannii]